MRKHGFSFLEVLAALAILAVISAALMPLFTGLASTDHTLRLRARAWAAARSRLTAHYLRQPDAEAGQSAFTLAWTPVPPAGPGLRPRTRLSVVPKNGTKPALELTVRSGGDSR
jgi:prepilin-type N-terminal cleavage/methylation domain-containing protein